MTGAELAWKTLRQLGVSVVFGVPGGAILPLVDAMVAHQDAVDFIVTRHESAAIHAADGYARVTGRPALALATSGPGGTNVITGLATAMTDSVPLVLIVGQVPTTLIGTDAFQEADLFEMTMPVVKHSWRITRAQDVDRIFRQAYKMAGEGRPGPVVVEFPKNIQFEEAENVPALDAPTEQTAFSWHPEPLAWAKAQAYLKRAQRPVLYVGGGVSSSGTSEWILRLAERYDCPVTTTLLGLGAFPANHILSLGMLGMHGTWYANTAMQEADLIVACGVRFDDRVTGKLDEFAPKARIIHMEVDPAEVNKLVHPDVVLQGNLTDILPRFMEIVPITKHPLWRATVAEWIREHPLKVPKAPVGTVASAQALQIIAESLDDEDVVVTEVGQHQMWTALFLPRNLPRRFLTSGGAGTMGYGFPSSLGAKVATPDHRVILIAGDGSFQMNLQEMATLAQYQIGVRIIVFNNAGHGMVRQWQDLFHGQRRYGVRLFNPDFVKLAESFGIKGFSVNTVEGLKEALTVADQVKGPVLLEVTVPEDEHVYPMVPAGRSLSAVLEG